MNAEFWMGLYYGVAAGALPVLAWFGWHLHRSVTDSLKPNAQVTFTDLPDGGLSIRLETHGAQGRASRIAADLVLWLAKVCKQERME